MRFLRFLSIVCATLFLQNVVAQTAYDSLSIVNAKWNVTEFAPGLTGRTAAFTDLYGGPMYVSIVEVNAKLRRGGIAVSRQMKPLPVLAREHAALAAINGSYYDMKAGNSVCFLKVDDMVLDTTTASEGRLRVTGAVRVRKGKVQILPWNRKIEKGYKKKRGTVLASGPLLVQNGRVADWSMCGESFCTTKHPRSAIALTRDKRVLLIAVDGRAAGNSIGASIPEMAHLARVLGAKTALNLDGGGSTTLYLGGDILNHPTDNKKFDHEGVRSIPNIIYFK